MTIRWPGGFYLHPFQTVCLFCRLYMCLKRLAKTKLLDGTGKMPHYRYAFSMFLLSPPYLSLECCFLVYGDFLLHMCMESFVMHYSMYVRM